jgi:hypothetical protein
MIEAHPYIAVCLVGAAMLFAGVFIGWIANSAKSICGQADESEQPRRSIFKDIWKDERNLGVGA